MLVVCSREELHETTAVVELAPSHDDVVDAGEGLEEQSALVVGESDVVDTGDDLDVRAGLAGHVDNVYVPVAHAVVVPDVRGQENLKSLIQKSYPKFQFLSASRKPFFNFNTYFSKTIFHNTFLKPFVFTTHLYYLCIKIFPIALISLSTTFLSAISSLSLFSYASFLKLSPSRLFL